MHQEVRSFLTHARSHRHFIKNFSKETMLLTNLLAKDMPFHFSEECHMAFTKFKGALTFTPILYPPTWECPFELNYDSFYYTIGVVLGQRVDKKPQSFIMLLTLRMTPN